MSDNNENKLEPGEASLGERMRTTPYTVDGGDCAVIITGDGRVFVVPPELEDGEVMAENMILAASIAVKASTDPVWVDAAVQTFKLRCMRAELDPSDTDPTEH
jgi:hypothetical protein